ncbi:MAG TPA: hypothetical protein VH044_09415 [Polyangiaceae bacterium]|jgi:hypothetical protein|nr:hypothetical protein [Polyangiaceae bacterium]
MRDSAKLLMAVLGCGLAGGTAAMGCGSGGHGGGFELSSGDAAAATGDSDGGVEASEPSTTTPDDGGAAPGIFTSGDAGITFDCQPGTYTGAFSTMVTSDAGGLFSLFSFGWMGNLSITLQGQVTQGGGGEIPLPTLTIAPGAKLAGVDAMNGHFTADLTGQLDCPSKTLTATIANGNYNYFGDASGIPLEGTMSATYDGTSTPPALTGQMSVTSSQVPSLMALGSWTATLQ